MSIGEKINFYFEISVEARPLLIFSALRNICSNNRKSELYLVLVGCGNAFPLGNE